MAHFYFIAVNIGQIIVNISQLYLFVKYFFINNLILIIMLYSVKKDLLHNILWCFSMARYSHLKWTDRRFYPGRIWLLPMDEYTSKKRLCINYLTM
jgi:hypothetical protein